MERDERGRPVRRRPRRHAPPAEVGFPEPEHDQWSLEGEIERLGLLARGTRRRSHSPWVRVAVWVVTLALLLPLVLGVVNVVWGAFDG